MNDHSIIRHLSTPVILLLWLMLTAVSASPSSISPASRSSNSSREREGSSKHPHAHPHHQQQVTEDSGMHKRSICSQGSCQWYFQSKGQTSFQMLPDGSLVSFKPPRDRYPDTAVFRMSAVHSTNVWCLSRNARPVTIKAVLANAYVCLSTRGKVYSSAQLTGSECMFCEEHRTDLHFVYYRVLSDSDGRGQGQHATPLTHGDVLYLGVNSRCGKMMDGRRGRACANITANQRTPHFCADVQFVKLPPADFFTQPQLAMTSSHAVGVAGHAPSRQSPTPSVAVTIDFLPAKATSGVASASDNVANFNSTDDAQSTTQVEIAKQSAARSRAAAQCRDKSMHRHKHTMPTNAATAVVTKDNKRQLSIPPTGAGSSDVPRRIKAVVNKKLQQLQQQQQNKEKETKKMKRVMCKDVAIGKRCIRRRGGKVKVKVKDMHHDVRDLIPLIQ